MLGAGALAGVGQARAATVPVDVDFLEAVTPGDTTASERFQKDLDLAIRLTKDLLAKKLSGCGYNLRTHTTFYDANDPKQADERTQAAARTGAWMIVGPRRSNHYLAVAKAAKTVPTVSLMASASEVTELGPEHLSLSPSNSEMAQVAASEALRRIPKGATRDFVTIVSEDCVSCEDFAERFLSNAKKLGLNSVGRWKVRGDAPDTTSIVQAIRAKKPAFILAPNYSRTSGHLIATLQPAIGSGFFVGSDGWGDSRFGFVQGVPGIAKAKGFTVRGFPPVQEGLAHFRLGKTILSNARPNSLPLSGPSLAILRAMDGAVSLLCSGKPKNAAEFRAEFRKNAKTQLSAPWGVSIYDLEGTEIRFKNSVALPVQPSQK